MGKIEWCFKKEKGIKLIKPNKNIAKDYLSRSKSDFENLDKQNKVWKIIISYYVCYNAFYSVVISCGIKSEIHSCTISLIKFFPKLKKYHSFLKVLKKKRINTQYYLKSPEPEEKSKIKKFLDLCELELYEINQEKISRLRKKLNKIKEKVKSKCDTLL